MSFNYRPYQMPITAAYIPHYIPVCCSPPPNTDPKRFTPYCATTPSRSEPLSAREYLVKRRQANWAPLSAAAALTQVGATVTTQNGRIGYGTTLWTETRNTGACCYGGATPAIPVPAVYPGGYAKEAGLLTQERGSMAARGSLSVYDTQNHIESITTRRREGYAIASDPSFDAPAGGSRAICATCQPEGTGAMVGVGNPACQCGTPVTPNY